MRIEDLVAGRLEQRGVMEEAPGGKNASDAENSSSR